MAIRGKGKCRTIASIAIMLSISMLFQLKTSSIQAASGVNGGTPTIESVSLAKNLAAVKVNPSTHQVYVTSDKSIIAINGTTKTINANKTVDFYAHRIAISSGKVYITEACVCFPSHVYVFDDSNNSIIGKVAVSAKPAQIAINPATNKIYVTFGSNLITIIDGLRDKIVENITGIEQQWNSIAVDTESNTLFVAETNSSIISVIDGISNKIIRSIDVPAGEGGQVKPIGNTITQLAVNSLTHTVYASNIFTFERHGTEGITMPLGTLAVINGSTGIIISNNIQIASPSDIVVTPSKNRIYVSEYFRNDILVIDGSTNIASDHIRVGESIYPDSFDIDDKLNQLYLISSNSGDLFIAKLSDGDVPEFSVSIAVFAAAVVSSIIGGAFLRIHPRSNLA